MTRDQQHQVNQIAIERLLKEFSTIPSYECATDFLNGEDLKTSWGLAWTHHSLYRMLQRAGYSGLWGLFREHRMNGLGTKKGAFLHK